MGVPQDETFIVAIATRKDISDWRIISREGSLNAAIEKARERSEQVKAGTAIVKVYKAVNGVEMYRRGYIA